MAWQGRARRGKARLGKAILMVAVPRFRNGLAGPGAARQGGAGQIVNRLAYCGSFPQRLNVTAVPGTAGRGSVRMGRVFSFQKE